MFIFDKVLHGFRLDDMSDVFARKPIYIVSVECLHDCCCYR